MTINTRLFFTISGENKIYDGSCKDLSHTGIKFVTEHPLSQGTILEITIDTNDSKFKSLKAKIEVIRAMHTNDNKYIVAGKILEYK